MLGRNKRSARLSPMHTKVVSVAVAAVVCIGFGLLIAAVVFRFSDTPRLDCDLAMRELGHPTVAWSSRPAGGRRFCIMLHDLRLDSWLSRQILSKVS